MEAIRKFFNAKILLLTLVLVVIFTIAACNNIIEDPTEDVAVTSIEVTSANNIATITENGGTLQMSASVFPDYATDPSITWSVVNGTGIANINSSGLLTAQTNGDVTVIATSVMTPSVSGTKVISISNQDDPDMEATLLELNVDDMSVLDFNPLVMIYTHILSSGVTTTPVVTGTPYDSTANVVIDDAIDVTSSNEEDRTTTITVTATGDKQYVYKIIFESQADTVDLRSAGNFVILAESGVSTSPPSVIIGDIGLSPSAATYLTGFSVTMHSSGEYSTSDQVTGRLYASDYATPTPGMLTTAIEDMMLAYTDAAGRAANYTELYSGDLSGKTLSPGVFKYGTSVLINNDLTLNGSATDVWIFQISGNLTMASDINIILEGGAQAKNIFWQVGDTVAIGSGAHFEGIILAKTDISMGTNSSINGQLYAQTAVTLNSATVTKSEE